MKRKKNQFCGRRNEREREGREEKREGGRGRGKDKCEMWQRGRVIRAFTALGSAPGCGLRAELLNPGGGDKADGVKTAFVSAL